MVLLLAFCFIPQAHGKYARMSRKEIKQYKITYGDLILAFSEKNFTGFKIHGEKFIQDYENVLLDPSSVDLREDYYNISSLLKGLEKTITLDRHLSAIDSVRGCSPSIEMLHIYEHALTFLLNVGLDSLYNTVQKAYLAKVEITYSFLGKSIEAFESLSLLKHIPSEYFKAEGKQLEESMRAEFIKLTAGMDITAIREFKHKYKGIFTEEIYNLEERCRTKDRLSLLRNDGATLEGVNKYMELYPKKDLYFENKIREQYANKIKKSGYALTVFSEYKILFPDYDQVHQKMEEVLVKRAINGRAKDCENYLRLFPKGRWAADVQSWLRTVYYATFENNNAY